MVGYWDRYCQYCEFAIKNCTYHLCKRQSADTVIIIGRYRLSAFYDNHLAHNRLISIIGASLVSTTTTTTSFNGMAFFQDNLCKLAPER